MFKKINFLLSKNDKISLIFLLLGLFVLGILELLSIGSIPVLITYFFNKDNQVVEYLNSFFGRNSNQELIIFFSLIVLFIFVIKNFFLIIFNYFENLILRNLSISLGNKIFLNYLNFNYLKLKKFNSSDITKNITHNVDASRNLIAHILKILKELIVVIVFSSLLIYYNFKISFLLITSFAIIFIIFYKLFSSSLFIRGRILQNMTAEVLKNVSQTFGSIKDIIILNKFKIFSNNFHKINQQKYSHTFFQRYISTLPRIFFELTLLLIFCIISIYYFANGYDISEFLAFISLVLVSGLRLMPSFSIFSTSSTSIKFSLSSLNILYNDFENEKQIINYEYAQKNLPKYNYNKLSPFIFLKDVSFQYKGTEDKILENLDFKVDKVLGKKILNGIRLLSNIFN